ncbi:MerR family transcriptional regulator [Saccharomonospora sp. NPDC006951]
MRMAELSRESGVPVPTIKYYLREGILPPGERTSPNQARYDESHVRRLKLVRAMLDVGGLSIADVHRMIAAIDQRTPTHNLLGIVQHGLPRPKGGDDSRLTEARRRAEAVIEERAWKVEPDCPAAVALAGVLATFAELGQPESDQWLSRLAEAADIVAEADLDSLAGVADTEAIIERALVGTVLGDTLFAVLRRLAQQNVSAERFGGRSTPEPPRG